MVAKGSALFYLSQMRPTRATSIFSCVLVGAAILTPAAAEPLPDSDQLYRRIRERYQPMYAKFRGVETKNQTETRIYNSKTNELKETSALVSVGRHYFYDEREQTVLKYVKNGEVQDPEDFKQRGSGEPMHPIWDAKGPENYRIHLLRRTEARGAPCYLLRVTPTRATPRHFKGLAYIHAETLDLIRLDGGMAKLPFGVESVEFKADLKTLDNLLVVESVSTKARAHIPILFPNVMFVSESKLLEARGIPR